MSYLEEVEEQEDRERKERIEKNKKFFESLSDKEKFHLLWKEYTESTLMDISRRFYEIQNKTMGTSEKGFEIPHEERCCCLVH